MRKNLIIAFLFIMIAVIAYMIFGAGDAGIKVGVCSGVPGVNMTNNQGAEYDIAKLVGNRMGQKIKYKNISFYDIMSSTDKKVVSMGMAGFSGNSKKIKMIEEKYPNVMCINYAPCHIFLVTKNAKENIIGVQSGSVNEEVLLAEKYKDAKIKTFSCVEDMLKAFEDGQINGYVVDTIHKNCLSIAADIKITKLQSNGINFFIIVDKSNDNLIRSVHEVLKDLKNPVKTEVPSAKNNTKVENCAKPAIKK